MFALLYSAEEVDGAGHPDPTRRSSASLPQIRTANFTVIGTDDLERLFVAYDREYFRGRLAEMLHEDGVVSQCRSGCSGGDWSAPRARPCASPGRLSGPASRRSKFQYEIAVSTTLLFSTFREVDRPVTVGGLVCRDRLEALQRIFEHELLHLAEFLVWGRSSCRPANFHALSQRSSGTRGSITTW